MPPTPKTMCAVNIYFQSVKMWGDFFTRFHWPACIIWILPHRFPCDILAPSGFGSLPGYFPSYPSGCQASELVEDFADPTCYIQVLQVVQLDSLVKAWQTQMITICQYVLCSAICKKHILSSVFSSIKTTRKARLNEWKIGVASKAWSGMWRLVRGTSYLRGPASPCHRPHRQSERHFAWVSRCGSRMVRRTGDRRRWPRWCNYLEYLASSDICPFWHNCQMGCRWLAASKRVSSLATAEAVASRQAQTTTSTARDAETVPIGASICHHRACRARADGKGTGCGRLAHWT